MRLWGQRFPQAQCPRTRNWRRVGASPTITDNSQPAGPGDSEGFLYRIPFRAKTKLETTPSPVQPEPSAASRTRSRRISKKGSVIKLAAPPEDKLLSTLFLVPEWWWSETCHKSEGAKQFCDSPSLQNGGYTHTEEFPTTKGLVGVGGSERCLLLNSYTPKPQEVMCFPLLILLMQQ